MRKVAFIFILSVLAPSLVLAWLVVRSLSDQRIIFERQQTLLYTGACNGLVKDILDFLSERESDFGRRVEELIAQQGLDQAARNFDEGIVRLWPLAEVGFAVRIDGQILSPPLLGRQEARRFRLENDLFLSNGESVEVYWKSPKGDIPLSKFDEKPSASKDTEGASEAKGNPAKGEKSRKVFPQKEAPSDGKGSSHLGTEEAEFKQVIGDASEGMLARLLQNKLKLLLWYRSSRNPQMVFGAQLRLKELVEMLRPLIRTESSLSSEICIALLDDNGQPMARSHARFSGDWKHPFVSAEIGEMLPHWEVAAYLLNPAKLQQSARTLALTLSLLVGVLLLAIGIGGWLIVADLRRHLLLARQKTDFVSNVSHELKTPLTSIRMFSELLAEGRVTEPDKQRAYLNVIANESARLTRLINNVLDFARMERGERKYQFQSCDLALLGREVIETFRAHLEAGGFQLDCRWPEMPALVEGDRDALAQVIVNLLSNAEKYSGPRREITVECHAALPASAEGPSRVELRILDRGMGVPAGHEEKIFEQFYRAHDSLSSGIPGSGLGLTLARQIARAHGGDVRYEARRDGGSGFILTLSAA